MVDEALASPRTSELVDRVIASAGAAAGHPRDRREPRGAGGGRQQTAGFVGELAAEVRRWARRLDARLDRHHASATPYAGLATARSR